MSSASPTGAAAPTSPPAGSRAIYLEFRNLVVALKQRPKRKDKKLQVQHQMQLLMNASEEQHQPSPAQHQRPVVKALPHPDRFVFTSPQPLHLATGDGACSTVSPPALSGSSPLIPYGSPMSTLEASPSPSAPLVGGLPSFPFVAPKELPSPPEFSFARALPSQGGGVRAGREAASEPMPHSCVTPGTAPLAPTLPLYPGTPSIGCRPANTVPIVSLPQQPAEEKKFILDDISGYALPGQLTAIMGASGQYTRNSNAQLIERCAQLS